MSLVGCAVGVLYSPTDAMRFRDCLATFDIFGHFIGHQIVDVLDSDRRQSSTAAAAGADCPVGRQYGNGMAMKRKRADP